MTRRLPSAPPQLPGLDYLRPLGSGGFADVFLYQQDMPRRAVAVKVLPVAMAYATWETVGLIAVTAISYQVFGESLGWLKLGGIALLVLGVVLVNAGAPKEAA